MKRSQSLSSIDELKKNKENEIFCGIPLIFYFPTYYFYGFIIFRIVNFIKKIDEFLTYLKVLQLYITYVPKSDYRELIMLETVYTLYFYRVEPMYVSFIFSLVRISVLSNIDNNPIRGGLALINILGSYKFGYIKTN